MFHNKKRLIKFFVILFLLLFLDIISKYLVYKNIPVMGWNYPFYPYGGIGIFKNILGISFSIVHVQNTGAAWGVFSNYTTLLFFLRILIVIFLIIYLLFFNKDKKKDIPLTLITTGAIGNIIDFIAYKKVIDMFYFKIFKFSYPVFNLADAMISIGIVYLILIYIFQKKK
ncbi:MAG: Lipoprotein signal peptidase [Candidatus Anoxychlamydiales bacterium]|nr:Lipoprotein signal peptidase [Candidatus Anoxychlamydiales bacterium]